MASVHVLKKKRAKLIGMISDHLGFLAGSVSTKGLKYEAYNLTTTVQGKTRTKHIFGEAFNGHLNADSYAGYNAINPKDRQACLAHLKRKADCCKIGKKRTCGELAYQKARALIVKLEKMRAEICLLKLRDKDAENLRNRISDPSRDGERLFVFLKVNGMEPTNNHAEQALRGPVIFRKICFGNRSLEGAENLAVNLSLLGTARRQNRSPIELLKTVLLRKENTPLEKLYCPENLPHPDSS